MQRKIIYNQRVIQMIMIVVLLILWPMLVFSAEVNLPKTGQITCYNESGNVIDCAGTGQDGDIQAGVEWPEPRFEDNGDGTVTDKLTGLVWLKDAGCSGTMTWENAVSYCNTLASGTCDLTDGSVAGDWRLPNIIEIESLLNAEVPIPASWLNSHGFNDVQSSYYWSATTDAENNNSAWIIFMRNGYMGSHSKVGNNNIWPVRDGESMLPNYLAKTWQTGQKTSYMVGDDGDFETGIVWSSPRFVDNNNGTITDNLTGLVWLKNANCTGATSWDQALNFCNNLSSGTCGLTDGSVPNDWRLPNRKEFLSLIDFSKYDPAIPTGHPFINVESSYYWSSTTLSIYSSYAWITAIYNGSNDSINNMNSNYIWPVRDGYILNPKFGDINNDKEVNLVDAILGMKISIGVEGLGSKISANSDVNGDKIIGMDEVVYILREIAKE